MLETYEAVDDPLRLFRILGEEDDEPDADAIVEGLIYAGSKHLLVSPPKVGKSVFAVALAAAVRQGRPFLGRATEPSRVLYLTEEQRSTFGDKCRKLGLDLGDDGFRYLRRSQAEVHGMPWDDVAVLVHRAALECRADLVVIDVLHRWAGFGEDGENSSGAVARVVGALDPLSEDGIATLILHHSPHSEKRARGSTDIMGSVDMLYYLDGTPGEDVARALEFQGGRHEGPERIAYRLRPDGGLDPLGSDRASSASRTSEAADAAVLIGPATTAEVSAELDWEERTARRWLERALRHKLVARDTGPHGEHVWRRRRRREYLRELGDE